MTTSAIFEGQVTHQRHKPMGHRLRYGVSSVLIDLDELEGLDHRIPIFSHNRWNLVSFQDALSSASDPNDFKMAVQAMGLRSA